MDAKISKFKIPVILKRDNQGQISLELQEDKKEFVGHDELPNGFTTNEVPKISSELSSYNEKQKDIVKGTLMDSEDERETSIVFKYLS
jgi:hypothetical protein